MAALKFLKMLFGSLLFSFLITACCDCETEQDQSLQDKFNVALDNEFEITGKSADSGYVYLNENAKPAKDGLRMIIKYGKTIYYAYPSANGWYAQEKNQIESYTLSELGHYLAEKKRNGITK